jgi:hypothetical protein
MFGMWTLKTTHLWSQTFPAERAVNVEHTPSVGYSAVFVETGRYGRRPREMLRRQRRPKHDGDR